MRADRLLVARGHFETRAKAQAAIDAGCVRADGQLVQRAAQPLAEDAQIDASSPHPWVSRGGLKLAAALDSFGVATHGRFALDVGASTGGFTDVLLKRGVAHVTAVDVGRGQLHPRLREDPRVTVWEATDARSLTPDRFETPPDLITADVAFISVSKALPAALSFSAADAEAVVLVKPQFELGAKRIGKGGLATGADPVGEASELVANTFAALGWTVRGRMPSPIQGGDGNAEGLLWLKRG